MSASNYLPPFDTDERTAMSEGEGADGVSGDAEASAEHGAVPTTITGRDAEVTYADFLGDEVQD